MTQSKRRGYISADAARDRSVREGGRGQVSFSGGFYWAVAHERTYGVSDTETQVLAVSCTALPKDVLTAPIVQVYHGRKHYGRAW